MIDYLIRVSIHEPVPNRSRLTLASWVFVGLSSQISKVMSCETWNDFPLPKDPIADLLRASELRLDVSNRFFIDELNI